MQTYLMVLPVQHFRLDAGRVALESAFVEHLHELRDEATSLGLRLTLAMPAMTPAAYELAAPSLATLDADTDSIEVITLPGSPSANARLIWKITANAKVIHSGLSFNLKNPVEFLSILAGVLRRRCTIFVADIDFRPSPKMPRPHASSLLFKFLMMQLHIAVRCCSIVLLKGKRFAAELGRGRPNVHAFLDAAHSADYLISDTAFTAKLRTLEDPRCPLELVYFGRLTPRKGIAVMLRATAQARAAGANVVLHVYGGGEQKQELLTLAEQLELGAAVQFHEALPYGETLFAALAPHHLLLAAPLEPDTPRSALDAMAAGIPFLAFDTDYYAELAETASGDAGVVTPWPSEPAFATAIVQLAGNRPRVAALAQAARVCAAANTQQQWIERRSQWLREALAAK